MRNSSNTTKTLGMLIEQDKFSFADATVGADEVYVVIKQLDELANIKALHGSNVYTLNKSLKVHQNLAA